MNENEFAELAAGYALGALSPEDAALFDAARARHPEWEHHVADDVATVSALADAVPAELPPPAIRASLLASIAATPQDRAAPVAEPEAAAVQAPATETVQAKERRRWTRGLFGLAASLVLLVALGLGAATIGEMLAPPTAVVALQEIEAAPDAQQASAAVTDGGEATLHWSESAGKAVLVSDGLPTIADEQSFELWFVRDGTPVSAGTFDADADGATALLEGAMEPGDVIAVTVEQAGGSPSGAPTTDPIVAIATA